MIGFNRFDYDQVKGLTDELSHFNSFVSLDISSLDASAPRALTHRAFMVLREILDLRGGWDNVFRWSKDAFENVVLRLPNGKYVLKPGGVPSGTGFTILIDSIIMAIVSIEILDQLGIRNYRLKVQGDDVLIALKLNGGRKARRAEMKELVSNMSEIAKSNFNLTFNSEKTHYATDLFVGIGQPKVLYPDELHQLGDCSRIQMKAMKQRFIQDHGRKPRFAEMVDFINRELEPEEILGWTHRWFYVFRNRVKFLSYYFHPNGGMLRPTQEVIDRIYNPERVVKTIDHHVTRLRAALIENYENAHVRNRMMHYFYDAIWLRRKGVLTHKEAIQDANDLYDHKRGEKTLPPLRRPTMHARAWYRRVDVQVDLQGDARFLEFSNAWDAELARAKATRKQLADMPALAWEWYRPFREGREYVSKDPLHLAGLKLAVIDRGRVHSLTKDGGLGKADEYCRALWYRESDPDAFNCKVSSVLGWERKTPTHKYVRKAKRLRLAHTPLVLR